VIEEQGEVQIRQARRPPVRITTPVSAYELEEGGDTAIQIVASMILLTWDRKSFMKTKAFESAERLRLLLLG
jgi:hypothetical protein